MNGANHCQISRQHTPSSCPQTNSFPKKRISHSAERDVLFENPIGKQFPKFPPPPDLPLNAIAESQNMDTL